VPVTAPDLLNDQVLPHARREPTGVKPRPATGPEISCLRIEPFRRAVPPGGARHARNVLAPPTGGL